MQQQITEAAAMLLEAVAMPSEIARAKVMEAMELLARALKDDSGVDVDKGGGS